MLPVHTVLHPTDFSDCSRAAFDLACAIVRDYNARLIVLHVGVPPMPIVPEALLSFDVVAFELELREMLRQVRPSDPSVRVEQRLVIEPDPVAEIVRLAEQEPCDLIVMGTHGLTGVRHALMGSVAEQVLREATCPVLTVRERLIN